MKSPRTNQKAESPRRWAPPNGSDLRPAGSDKQGTSVSTLPGWPAPRWPGKEGHWEETGVLEPGPSVKRLGQGKPSSAPSPRIPPPSMGQLDRNLVASCPQKSSVPVARMLLYHSNVCSVEAAQGSPAGHWAIGGESGSLSPCPTWRWLAALGRPGSGRSQAQHSLIETDASRACSDCTG